MAFFQKAPSTPEELERCKPLDIPPDQVLEFDEAEWYARAYRGDSAQLTLRAVLMGTVLGFFLSFTNIYVGLKTGWALGVALTACIVSFASWSFLLKIGLARSPMTILENNCMQSVASAAGFSTGNTLISAVPALLLLSGEQLSWKIAVPWVLFVALLGVVMAIPMKRNMINRERLKFPSGTAAAVTLQSFYGNGKEALLKARALGIAAAIAVVVPLLKDLNVRRVVGEDGKPAREPLFPRNFDWFDWLPNIVAKQWNAKQQLLEEKAFKLSQFHVRLDHSLVLLAAGALVGIRATFSMVVGGAILVFDVAPRALGELWMNPSNVLVAAAPSPGSAYSKIGIWYGAPMLVAYGLLVFAMQWRTVGRALRGLRGGAASGDDERTQAVEVPMTWFVRGMVVASIGLVFIAWYAFAIPFYMGILAVIMTFFLGLVACRATGETDITPGGAMGKIMQLTYGVLLPQNVKANLMTAAITSGAALASADLLNDLKSGYLLGANPRRQFLAQFLGIFTGTVASSLGYYLLVPTVAAIRSADDAHPAPFPAPAAQQWEAVARVFAEGFDHLHPMARHGIFVGVAWGLALGLCETWLPKYKKWIPSATGLGLGLILPFYQPLSMFLGAVLAWVFHRLSKKQAERFVVPVSSGLIAGESVIGVVVQGLNNFVLK